MSVSVSTCWYALNILRPRQNICHFPDNILKCIFLNENVLISIKISLKFVPMVWINNIPALVQIMAWRRPGNKPLFELTMVELLTHICITWPQWVNLLWPNDTIWPWSRSFYVMHYQGNLLRPWPQKLTVLVGQCWHLDPPFTCADKDLCR